MSNRTQVIKQITENYPELAEYFSRNNPGWNKSKASQPLVGVLRQNLSIFKRIVSDKQDIERNEAIEDAFYEILTGTIKDKKIQKIRKDLLDLVEKTDKADENNPIGALLKYGKFKDLYLYNKSIEYRNKKK